MCRLFAQISTDPYDITHHVLDSNFSILRQVIKEGHKDGWGTFTYEGGKAALLVRSLSSLEADVDLVRPILASRPSKISGFFVRKASNPLKLSFDEVHTAEATQPFVHMDLVFMHNGSVERPDLVMKALRDPEITPQSKNDSEVYFAVFVTNLKRTGSVIEALTEAEKFIRENGGEDPYSSLNSIVVYRGRVYAFNMYRKKYLGTLQDPERDYFKMSYWSNGKTLIVSSEPTSGDTGWRDLGNGMALEAWEEAGEIKHRTIEIKVI